MNRTRGGKNAHNLFLFYLLAWWILIWLSFSSLAPLHGPASFSECLLLICTKRTRRQSLQLIISCGVVVVRETGAMVFFFFLFWFSGYAYLFIFINNKLTMSRRQAIRFRLFMLRCCFEYLVMSLFSIPALYWWEWRVLNTVFVLVFLFKFTR